MDNAGDWLYIVLIAIAGISSLFSSLKKKKEDAAPKQNPFPDEYPKEEEHKEKGFWDILQEMQEQAAKVEKVEEPVVVETKVQKPIQHPTIHKAKRQLSTTLPTQPSALMEEPDNLPLVPEDLFHDPDELRKAVIYTEILNRKY